MAGTGTIILIFINVIQIFIFIALGVAFLVKRKKDMEDDNPIAINFMAHRSNGYAFGVELESTAAKNGRKYNIISPRDVTFKNFKTLKNQDVIVEKGAVVNLPKGTLSKQKNVNIYLASDPDDYPKPLTDTIFGKALQLVTTLNNADNTTIAALKEGNMRQAKHIVEMGDGEVSVERMTQFNEIMGDMFKTLSKSKDKSSESFVNKNKGS